MTSTAVRNKLHEYIRVVNDKKLFAIYNLLEEEIETTDEWWKNNAFTSELDKRYKTLTTGEDKGYTIKQLQNNIAKAKAKRYGNESGSL